MRRFLLYILIALLTFGVGYFTVFKPLLKDNKQLIKTAVMNDKPTEIISQRNISQKKIEYVCDNKIIKELEKHLNTQEFIQRVLDNSQIFQQDLKDNKLDCSKIYELKKIDLNKDKIPEIIVTGSTFGLCNMRGNCELWGFRKTETGYEQIIRHEWTFEYKISSKYTKGFADFEINANSSNGNPSNYLQIHKYNGKIYQIEDCFAEYEFGGNKKLKKTKRVREKCEQ